MYKKFLCGMSLLLLCLEASKQTNQEILAQQEILKSYQSYSLLDPKECDICEHLKHLRRLAKDSETVVELGTRDMVSTLGLLLGLTENGNAIKKYCGVDLKYPPQGTFRKVTRWCKSSEIDFEFIIANDLEIEPIDCDLLFIDTLHTYQHLTVELEKFSSKVKKYIAMHDTDLPWGWADEPNYTNIESCYPDWINPLKKGLYPAVEDFLARHPEWVKAEQYTICYGFTVLKRVEL